MSAIKPALRSSGQALRSSIHPPQRRDALPPGERPKPARLAEAGGPLMAAHSAPPPSRRSPRKAWPALGALTWSALLTLAFIVLCALLPQVVAPYPPTDMPSDAILSAPNLSHWFGTDPFGRDVFSLVVYGARQSLAIGVGAVLISAVVGVTIGLVAGYFGGWVDTALMRVTDVWMAVPRILLAIALSVALGPGLFNTILAISLADVPRYARVLRGQALAVRNRPFIEAARAAGATHVAILRGHVLPHCAATILVLATLGIASSILQGASLSFLGLGVNDERPDWGYLLTQGRGYLTVAWWIVTWPGLAITTLVVSVNLIGDALRRRLDPRNGPR